MNSRRSVVVTGGSSGLGAATAQTFHDAGFLVHVFDYTLLADTANSPYTFHQVDVRDDAQVEAAFNSVAYAGVPLTGIIHCAGITSFGPNNPGRLVDVENQQVQDNYATIKNTIDTNLMGTFSVVRHGAELISRSGKQPEEENGFIILTSSGAALEGKAQQSAYTASKAAIIGMTLPLAREFSTLGIRIVTIAPGLFDTPIINDTPKIERNVPFPHRVGMPEEFGKLALHICENKYLNAEVIRLDGGQRGEFKSPAAFIR